MTDATIKSRLGSPKVRIFPTIREYHSFVVWTLFPHPLFTGNPIILNLINWVVFKRAPLFYWAHSNKERLTYLGCYNIIPIVHRDGPFQGEDGRYSDLINVALTHLHEFIHILFHYPRSLGDMSRKAFNDLMQRNEWSASNFSEVNIYYLIPELLELTKDAFFRPSWIDRLLENGVTTMPRLSSLMAWRQAWIENPDDWEEMWITSEAYEGLREYMRRFFAGNEDFNYSRFERLFGVKGFADPGLPSLPNDSFMATLETYQAPEFDERAQERYEWLQLTHMQLLYRLLELPSPPQTFAEMLDRQDELNKVDIVMD